MNRVFLVRGARTPFGRYCGALKDYDYYDLGAIPVHEIIKDIPNDAIDEMFFGIGDTSPTKDVFTPLASRQIAFLAGLPRSLTTTCIEKACVSSTSAARLAFLLIKHGEIGCAIAGGCTSFSQTPHILRGMRMNHNLHLYDPVDVMGIIGYPNMMQEVDATAKDYRVSREEIDDWAYGSHRKYQVSYDSGKYDDELVVMRELLIDEQFRRDVDISKMRSLKPIEGDITPGNCPGKNDGASAVMLMSESRVKCLGLEPIAELVDIISTAGNPTRTAEQPAIGVKKILTKHKIEVDDVKRFEVNEAFSSLMLVFFKMMNKPIANRTNINGGAIAIGHANAASGTRLMITLGNELKRCGGIGVGSIGGALGIGDTFILRRD